MQHNQGHSGYHQGNAEQLPQSVALTETLAVSSLWVWLIAGFTTAAVRMLDEDADGLPLGLPQVSCLPLQGTAFCVTVCRNGRPEMGAAPCLKRAHRHEIFHGLTASKDSAFHPLALPT